MLNSINLGIESKNQINSQKKSNMTYKPAKTNNDYVYFTSKNLNPSPELIKTGKRKALKVTKELSTIVLSNTATLKILQNGCFVGREVGNHLFPHSPGLQFTCSYAGGIASGLCINLLKKCKFTKTYKKIANEINNLKKIS